MDFTPIQHQKSILQCSFQNFDREKEFCKNLPLFLILRAYLNHRIYKESILWCVKNQYFWHSTIGKYWQWVISCWMKRGWKILSVGLWYLQLAQKLIIGDTEVIPSTWSSWTTAPYVSIRSGTAVHTTNRIPTQIMVRSEQFEGF